MVRERSIQAGSSFARSRSHLEKLVEKFRFRLNNVSILAGTGTDYPYRIVIESLAWMSIAERLAADIDYTNFKDTIHEKPYKEALMDVWLRMQELEASSWKDLYFRRPKRRVKK